MPLHWYRTPCSMSCVAAQKRHGTYLGLGLLDRSGGGGGIGLLLVAARALLLLLGQRGRLVRVGAAEEPGRAAACWSVRVMAASCALVRENYCVTPAR